MKENREINEELSALVDGEVSLEDIENLLEEVLKDTAVRETFARYQLIGDILRDGAQSVFEYEDIRKPLAARLAKEPLYADEKTLRISKLPVNTSRAVQSSKRRSLSLLAIAASVVLGVTVTFLYQFTERAPLPESEQTIELSQQGEAPLYVSRWAVSESAVEARLRRYLVSHSKHSGRGVQGMHPYARVVVYQQ